VAHVVQSDRLRVERVNLGDGVDELLGEQAALLGVGEALGLLVTDDVAIEAFHHVKIRPDDGVVVTPRDGPGDGHVGVLQRIHHAVLAEHLVGGVGRLARRRATDDEFVVAPVDEQRLVGVALLVVLDLEAVGGTELVLEERGQGVAVDESLEVVALAHDGP